MSEPREDFSSARLGATRPTIHDVAREAGVSKSTVSLVLNTPDQVGAASRRAVLAAINRLGYRPSRAAATLRTTRTNVVGLVTDDFRNLYFVDLLEGLREVMGPRGYQVTVGEHFVLKGASMNAIDALLDSQVDALVVAAEPGRDFPSTGVPTVVEGTRLHDIAGADRVASDQEAGVRMLIDHLFSLGHTAIGHVTGSGGSARARRRAYESEMTSRGATVRIVGEDGDPDELGGFAGTEAMLDRFPEVTAIFTANDTMAVGAWGALRRAGKRIPDDVALVGYDNSLLARSEFLDLTTIDNHTYDVGCIAAHALLRRLDDPSAQPQQVLVQPQLVVRSSTSGED